MGNSVYCFTANPDDRHSGVALSALINALYETNMVIIVRRAYSKASSPRIGFLSPHIKANYEVCTNFASYKSKILLFLLLVLISCA